MNRFRSRVALASVPALVLLLASGCGMDPPGGKNDAAPGSNAGSAPNAPAVIQGAKPTPVDSLSAVTESSASVKCNIETIGGENLEGVRPTVNTHATVGVAGWYFAGKGAPATTAAPATPANADTAAGGAPDAAAGAAPAASSGMQLVISNEDGSKNWAVPVPARTERPDVADFLKEPAALQSGFAFDLDLSGLAPGAYNIHLSDTAHSAASVCGLGRGFLVQ
jgi:hypothetical protein